MKRNLKAIALLITIAELSAFTLSCGNTADTPEVTTEPESTTAEETSEYKNPGVNYGGDTFTFLEYNPESYFWKACSYSDIRADEDSGDPINDAQYKRNRKVEEELKIKLETIKTNGGNQDELRKLILAGDKTADVAQLFYGSMAAIVSEEGMIQNWKDVATLDLSASWWDQNAVETFTFGSGLNVITGDLSIYSQFAPMLLFYNKRVAEMYKINDCYDLVRAGKWTNDKVYEYCRVVADDLNGDGKMDENDRFGMAEQTGLIPDMLISSGENIARKNQKGELELVVGSERVFDLQTKFYKFLRDYDVNCEAGQYASKYKNVFFELHIPMFKNDQLLFNYNQLLIAIELRAMDADYGLLPTPKADESQENYRTSVSGAWATFYTIPATNDRLDMTGHVMDALGYYSKEYVTSEYIDTTIRQKGLRDEDSAEMLELILASKAYDTAIVYNWGYVKNVLNDSANISSAYSASESKIKADFEATIAAMK